LLKRAFGAPGTRDTNLGRLFEGAIAEVLGG